MAKTVTNLGVTYPLLHTTASGEQYYTYGIIIKTNDPAFAKSRSLVWRRYSEFVVLRKILKDNTYMYNAITKIPELPEQGIFKDRCHKRFLNTRCIGLQQFLNKVVNIDVCRSDKALHLFLQTSISASDILLNIKGKRHDKIETEDNIPSLSIYEVDYLKWNPKSSKENNKNRRCEPFPKPEPEPSISSLIETAKPVKKVTFSKIVQVQFMEKCSSKRTL